MLFIFRQFKLNSISMKNYVFILIPLIFVLITACNNQEATDENGEKTTQTSSEDGDAENLSDEGGEAAKKSSEKSETAFVQEEKTIVGRFDQIALSTVGAYYIVYDKDNERYTFYENSDAEGMDFIYDYPPNEPLEELDDKWFNITYENRMIEFYDGGSGEYVDREKIVITKVEPAEANLKTAKTAKIDKSVVSVLSKVTVSGTEPFWSVALHPDYASYSSPSIQSVRLNYLYPHEEATCDLKNAAKKLNDNGVKIRLQDAESDHISVLTIYETPCSDGMSDNEYPFTVSYKVNDEETLSGCGRIRE
jgi:uncharacterized membrane protein